MPPDASISDNGVRYRCCWWAADAKAWELGDLIEPLAGHPDEDIRAAAQAFVELRDEGTHVDDGGP